MMKPATSFPSQVHMTQLFLKIDISFSEINKLFVSHTKYKRNVNKYEWRNTLF